MAIESAKDLYVANGADLRHWHDVSSDIIKFLKDKFERASSAVAYKGVLPNLDSINSIDDAAKGDVWTNEETGVNFMWNGEEWIPVSLYRVDFDKEAIEDSTNGIQSGYIWKSLQNFIDDPSIYRIVDSADDDSELQNHIYGISNQLADLIQDLEELKEKYGRIPDPVISTQYGNEILKSEEDGGAYFNSEDCHLADRVAVLENAVLSENATTVVSTDGTSINVNDIDSELIYIEADQDVHLDFSPMEKHSWMTRYVYIEALADISLFVENAEFANVEEDPHYGQEGYGMLIKCIWVGGKVILEVLDNSQCRKNVESWKEDSEESEDQEP